MRDRTEYVQPRVVIHIVNTSGHMADSAVLIFSALLCYIRGMFGDGLTKQRKIAVFYAESELEDARIFLQKSIDELMAA